MRIALIGNMNNNNFSMLRYFRDLGADAHLLLYAGDGKGTLQHFRPEFDTWNYGKWVPYIHQTDIPNAQIAVYDFPLSWLLAGRSMLRTRFGLQDDWVKPVSRRALRRAYRDYDVLVASGITPAALQRINRKLDVFYPYSIGVEFLGTVEFVARPSSDSALARLVQARIVKMQAQGIRAARHVLSANVGLTQDVLRRIGVVQQHRTIPMVYREPLDPARGAPTPVLQDACKLIDNSRFSLLHQARIVWRNNGRFSEEAWVHENKRTNLLLSAFAELVSLRPELRPLLLIVEYGPDVAATKELAAELGITDRIHWLPKLPRRELMWLLARVSVGCGEFYAVPGVIWGGTGWEALASGKPLLQGFNFADGQFERIYGFPPPPMLAVRTPEDIVAHLVDMADNPSKRELMGRSAREWFDRHNGAGLAKQWLNLLTQ